MKKLLLILGLLVSFAVNTKAQVYKNEVSVVYSTFTVPQAVYVFGGVFGAMFSLGHFTFDNTIMSGALAFEYTHWVNNWFGYGGSVYGEFMTADAYSVDKDGNKTPNGRFNMGFASLTPMAKFMWFNHPRFGMYSKIAAGLCVGFSEEPSFVPAVQVSPVCMEFGGGSWRGLVEIGIGMQGILAAGVKKSF
jgi:hypothetical protein